MPCVLVYGGSGQLGCEVAKRFLEANFDVISVDLRPSDQTKYYAVIKGDGSLEDSKSVVDKIRNEWKMEVDVVICVAGGFNMQSIKDDSIFSGLDRMLSFNLRSAVSACYVAAHTLKTNGLVILTGASSALQPTPTMLGYGLSKAATHHLVASLAQEGSGLPKGSSVMAILPITLDTQQNRKDMPQANWDDWTPLDHVSELLLSWVQGHATPKNGDLIQIKTVNKKTECHKV